MQRQPRLSRKEVVARLRALGAQQGALSLRWVEANDRQLVRSLRLHFSTFAQACRAARVEVAGRQRRASGPSGRAVWSKDRVVGELGRLADGGASTGWAELMVAEQAALVRAATVHAGGLEKARAAAGIEPSLRPARGPGPGHWDPATIVAAIQARARDGETLASSRAPQPLVAAARWHFASWDAALAAAGVDPGAVRLQRGRYTRDDIVAVIRGMAGEGIAVRPSTLRARVKLDSVRKLFGSVDAAVRAAGIEQVVTHGNQKWSRDRVIEELKARAARGEDKLSRGLARAVQLYFGGAHRARAAAGLPQLARRAWTQEALIDELRRRARRGESCRTLSRACKRLFGSVAAAREAAAVGDREVAAAGGRDAAASSGRDTAAGAVPGEPATSAAVLRALVAELRHRLQHGARLGGPLAEQLRQAFGSLAVARALAERPRRGRVGDEAVAAAGWQRWSHGEVIERLRAWQAKGGGALSAPLTEACRRRFGSVVRACAEAGVAMPRTWTPQRIRQALRDPRADLADPELVEACIQHFGSVTAARAAAERSQRRRTWSKAKVIAELQARGRRGLAGVGRLLRGPAIRLFGSSEAALAAAAVAPRPPGSPRTSGTRG